MSEGRALVAEIAREVAAAETLTTYLRNIAHGSWNADRLAGDDLTVLEYAAEGLRIAGLEETR